MLFKSGTHGPTQPPSSSEKSATCVLKKTNGVLQDALDDFVELDDGRLYRDVNGKYEQSHDSDVPVSVRLFEFCFQYAELRIVSK